MSKPRYADEAAFPRDAVRFATPDDMDNTLLPTQWGLTKRELFAAMAMQGMLANSGGPIQANPTNGWSLTNCDSDDVAHVACLLADSLLAKLAS